jgi:hypothetical protein
MVLKRGKTYWYKFTWSIKFQRSSPRSLVASQATGKPEASALARSMAI